MKALLRFQAVVLGRMVAGPWVAALLVSVGVLLWVCAMSPGPNGALPVFLVIVGILLPTMTYTLGALDAVRWAAPVRTAQVFGAHALFWALACVVPAGAVAAARAAYAGSAPFLFVDLMLLVAVVVAAATMFQRAARHGRFRDGALLSVLVVGSITPMGAAILFAWSGDGAHGAAILAGALVVWTAVSTATFLRDEWSPSGAGARTGRDESVARCPVKGRPPIGGLLRATYPPLGVVFHIAMGFAFPLLFRNIGPLTVWSAFAARGVAGMGTSSWRWLIATPLDRGRAVRLLLLPALLFAVGSAAARIVAVECVVDRSEFFRDPRKGGGSHGFLAGGKSSVIGLSDVLQSDGSHGYRPPDVQRIADEVQWHLRKHYGLRVPTERIAAAMLRGWPGHPPTEVMDWDQTPTLDAIERVRVDLADELRAADRFRQCFEEVLVLLLFLWLLWTDLSGWFRGYRVWWSILGTMIAISTLVVIDREVPIYAAFQDAPAPVPALLFLAAATLGVLLWRSSVRAFRRLDLTELPPRSNAWRASTKQV